MRLRFCCIALAACILSAASPAHAMHISEGILPFGWAILWFAVALPLVALGLRDLRRFIKESANARALVGLMGAAVFLISCMPIPVPIAGTSSHPCGTGIAAIIIGPSITVLITSITLLLQALFLAHGGLTTLGADICSMGVAGAFSGYAVFRLARAFRVPVFAAALMAGVLADWSTYSVTAVQLALALTSTGSFLSLFTAILIAFMPTQIPLGLLEGVVTAWAYTFVINRRPDLIVLLSRKKTVEVVR